MTSEELLTQVDENDEVIGLKPRSEFDNGRLIHRSVYLLVRDSKGEILLQKRPDSKRWHPGLYSFSVTGTVRDETYNECVARRIFEEFGKAIDYRRAFKFHHFDDVDKAFKTVYFADVESKTVFSDRKNEFLWLSLDELREELAENPQKFAPPFLTGMRIHLKS